MKYAFFSATDAAAALEQAEKHRRREAGEDDEDEEDEEDEDGEEEGVYESGDEVEAEDRLGQAVAETSLEDGEEDGWPTEGEGEDGDDVELGEVERRLGDGEEIPLRLAAQEVKTKNGLAEEDIRTRVLSVTELEDLFQNASPDLKGLVPV